MGVSLIISVYNDYTGLRCVLNSLLDQSDKEFEILIAHDSEDAFIQSILSSYSKQLSIRLLQQEDKGFRKNNILNKAIDQAKYLQLVFIDGD